MFKKRKRKVAVLENMIMRQGILAQRAAADEDIDDEYRKAALEIIDEETDALIAAAVAYRTEPLSIAVHILTTVLCSVLLALICI